MLYFRLVKILSGIIIILFAIQCSSQKKVTQTISSECKNDGIYACAFDEKSGNWIRIPHNEGLTRLVIFIDDCCLIKDSLLINGSVVYARGLKDPYEIPYEGHVKILSAKETTNKQFEIVQNFGVMDSTGKFSITIPALFPDIWLIFSKDDKLPAALRFTITKMN